MATDEQRDAPEEKPKGLRELGAVNFFMADVRVGLGPFLATYLATRGFGHGDVGLALMVGGFATVLAQAPAGALIDAVRSRRAILAAATVAIAIGALVLAWAPNLGTVFGGQVIVGIAGAFVGPAMAALTLSLVGSARMAKGIGSNQRFDAAGNVASALVLGFAGYLVSQRSMLVAAACFSLPALFCLSRVPKPEGEAATAKPKGDKTGLRELFRDARLRWLCASVLLFHFGNAAMLPLLGERLGRQSKETASLWMGGCVLVTQATISVLAPFVGAASDRFGRRRVLLVGFAALPLRGAICAAFTSPAVLLATQVLDGVGAAIFGVVSLTMMSDLIGKSGRFNLAQGALGAAVGAGAALSNAIAGRVTDRWGDAGGFGFLGVVALAALALGIAKLPETRDEGARA